MASHGLTEEQYNEACRLFFEEHLTLGAVALRLRVPINWLTGGDSLLGEAQRRDREGE